ncbi:YwqG family protein [Umezawaea endophytica]|uniref:YwqG family protein n=1 Tax=Umezawaea endophytica TaxID=1654476 RepID=A0A9X2VJD0_9PSEU|nr:YwqG family protein [Umezawaea endophytica]MCS7477785.1 YwqG family protein [Umezawaea endophytica]
MAFIDESTVAGLAEDHGVPADVARELAGLLRPCVLLVERGDLPEGTRPAGRSGGLPALPEDVEWPGGAGPFAMTVDCAALPHDWLDIDLPRDGHLLFFTTFQYEPEDSVVLHVPAGTPTAERALPEDLDSAEDEAYEPRELFPLPGLSIDHDWYGAPAATALRKSDPDRAEKLDGFVEVLVSSVHNGPRPHPVAQLGGFSVQWQEPPDQDGLVLFAQIAGNGVDHQLFTLNLVVGTSEDISARKWGELRFEQQC